jgi:hypothetical protein
MEDLYGLGETQSSAVKAFEKLQKFKAQPLAERYARFMRNLADEHAGVLEAGTATVQQAEARFYDLNIRAYTDMSDFFVAGRDIQPGETGIFKTRSFNQIGVRQAALSGGPPAMKFASVQSAVAVSTEAFGTSKYVVPAIVNDNFSIAKFQEREAAEERAAYEMKLAIQKYRINSMLRQPLMSDLATSIPAYYGSAPTIGATSYILDPGVQAGSMATTNALNLTSTGLITKAGFKKINTQMILQRRTAVALFVPVDPAVWEARFDEASPVALVNSQGNQNPANAIPPTEWEKRFNSGFNEQGQYIEMFNMRIWVQPVNILPTGYAILSTNEAAVLEYNKLEGSYSDEVSQGNAPTMKGYNSRVDYVDKGWLAPDPGLLNFSVIRYA